jgi:hypothetical protein
VAALRGETISDVVRDGVEAYIVETTEKADDIRAVDDVEARVAAGTEAVYEHDDVWREIAAMKGDDVVPAPVHRRRPS